MLNVAPCHDPEYALREVTRDQSEYYLRQGEPPGRWWGAGADAMGLRGEVEADALRALLAGRHPATGEWLVAARGSSARAATRRAVADLDTTAAAARLGLSVEGVRHRLRTGTLAGERVAGGGWRIPAEAVEAALAGRPQPRSAGPLPQPAPDGTYGVAEAARVAGVDASYLKRLVARGVPGRTVRDDGRAVQYLAATRDGRGRWRVSTDELARFRAARTGARAVPAYDLVMRAPKSVSILHALSHLVPAEVSERLGLRHGVAAEVAAAHHAAVADALALLERHAALVRVPGGRAEAEGLAVACFDHRSSRTGDPLLHTHAVIANVATGPGGRRAALDGTALYAWASTAGHVYQARLRAELVARLGVEFGEPHNGVADVVGVPRVLIEHFSGRRRQVLELMARLGVDGPRAAQAATLATRPPKDGRSHRTPKELAAQAARLGFGGRELAAVLGRGRGLRPSPQELGQVAARLAGPEGLTARATLVDLRDAVRGFATELAAGASGPELERWATTLLHDGRRFVPVLTRPTRASDVIRRSDGRRVRAGGIARSYSTPELLAHEAALLEAHARGLGERGGGVGLGVAAPGAVEAAVAARPTLSGEQVAMVQALTASGVGVEVVVGGPGSGKTYALGAAAEAWRASGLRVVGAALAGGAADVLAREARLDTQHTLTGLLARCDRVGAAYLSGAVVVVDESGMADTRQLSRLARYAAAARSKLVLVGDPDQIPEVGAGGAFGNLVAQLGDAAVVLRENRRQRDPADRERLELIRQGKAAAAIASALAAGRWAGASSADGVRLRLLADWVADPGLPGTAKLMIAPTVAEAEWLNRGAREVLRAAGALGPDAVEVELAAPDRAVDRRELRAGDVVRATRNDPEAGIWTGSVGTVAAVDPARRRVTVALDAGHGRTRTVALGPGFLEERTVVGPGGRRRVDPPGLAHAYASTAHAVQGRTAARAYVLVAAGGMSRQVAYVAASRAASETRFYGLSVPDPDEVDRLDGGRAAPEPAPDDVAALAAAMARDGAQSLASEGDPDAAEVARLMAMPTAWLWARHAEVSARVGARPPLAESVRRVRDAVTAAYGVETRALECGPLDEALRSALAVPGSTPEAVTGSVLRRGRSADRELASARDPLAVLVWAAGRAGQLAARRAPEATADHRRLALLDDAVDRQRTGRLAMAEHEQGGPVGSLLGPPPARGEALAAWRRAVAAVVDYRDAAGLFDRDTPHADPWHRVLGEIPTDAVLAGRRAQAVAAVEDARVVAFVAGLAARVPAASPRPAPEVEALAAVSLRELGDELAALGGRHGDRARLASAARAAARELALAYDGLAATGAPTPRGARAARRAAAGVRADVRAAAEARVATARARAGAAERALSSAGVDQAGRRSALTQAVAVRTARLRAAVLADPPGWARDHIRSRVRDGAVSSEALLRRLAAAYGDVAVLADRRGLDAGAPTLEALAAAPGAERVHRELDAVLDGPGPSRAAGIDLGR